MEPEKRIRIVLYTEQPFVAEGLAAVCLRHSELELAACRNNLAGTLEGLRSLRPDVLLVHVIAGISLSDLREIRSACGACPIVLWGPDLGGEFTFQAMQVGVRSILDCKISIEDFVAALRNVHNGGLSFDKDLLESVLSQKRVALSPRQAQIVTLVSQGLKNKEIAFTLGLTEGTIKVYLYKLFKKLGMNDRLDMALYGRKNLFGGQGGLERIRDTKPAEAFPAKAEMPRSLLLVARRQAGVTLVH